MMKRQRKRHTALLCNSTHTLAVPGGPHAHKHLHKVRAGDGEEGHICLAGRGLGQQCLARTGGPAEQRALGEYTDKAEVEG
jgi:hypothetical protein